MATTKVAPIVAAAEASLIPQLSRHDSVRADDFEKVDSIASTDTRRQLITKDGKEVEISWTEAEERWAVRKADLLFLPIFSVLFVWMAIDRTNVSGVLTSTFLRDTGITQDQANTGTSLLWLGIVLLEIPSNIILHRIGAHYWIPCQVIVWGIIEVLQYKVKSAGGWYAARFFLGLAESGFIPGSLYTLSRWYTQDELAKRTAIFFFGPSISASFGSLISAGAIAISDVGGLRGWQWIFVICGASTVASGVLALIFLPKSPRHTGQLLGGWIKSRAWLSEREADIYIARIIRADPRKGEALNLRISTNDIFSVLGNWRTWPHLIICLSGLQSVGGLSTWGATIIRSLGFTAIRANLLNAPPPIVGAFGAVALAWYVDRYKRFGRAIIASSIWTLAGLVALYHLPVTSQGSWAFYAAYFITVAAPGWQPLHVTWLSLQQRTPQQRAVAYAVYIGCSNLGGTYGNQVFRANDAPLYRRAWAACLALGAVWLATTIFQTLHYKYGSLAYRKKRETGKTEETPLYVDSKGREQLFYW